MVVKSFNENLKHVKLENLMDMTLNCTLGNPDNEDYEVQGEENLSRWSEWQIGK